LRHKPEFQRELVRDLRRVEVVPQGFERDNAGSADWFDRYRHRAAEPPDDYAGLQPPDVFRRL
jgi:hypothetical protein